MYTRILVALDKSELSQKAFQKSLFIAQACNAELQLLNVVSSSEAQYKDEVALTGSGYYANKVDESTQERWHSAVEDKLGLLESFVEEATKVGVSAEFVQEIGQPEKQICKYAQESDIDLIVIGSHGRKGLNELLHGSVSNYVSHHVPCDVMLIHQN